MKPHLGNRVSALVDGQLSTAEQEEALAHIAGCSPCALEVREERLARGVLSQCGDPAPSSELVAGLMGLVSGTTAAPPRVSRSHNDPFLPCTSLPSEKWSGALRSTRTWWGGFAVLAIAVGVGAPLMIGSGGASDRTITPLTAHSDVMSHVEQIGSDPDFSPVVELPADGSGVLDPQQIARWANDHGWAAPNIGAGTARVTRVGFSSAEPSHLEMLIERGSAKVLVRQTHGALDVGAVAQARMVRAGEGALYVISTRPVHIVWQSHGRVFELVAQDDAATAMDIALLFPVSEPRQGISSVVTALADIVGGAK